jgi:SAM-dependent methyltransferase
MSVQVEPRQERHARDSQRRRCPACLFSFDSSTGPLRMDTCTFCRTVSAWPLPSNEALAEYYNTDYAVVDAGLTPRCRDNWIRLLEEAERHTAGRRGLEVGSSNGVFLRLASERGWLVAGVELDARAREQHSRHAPAIPVWETLADAADAGQTQLDAVWILHTIEHLPDPESVLRGVSASLAPGGVLVVTTPNGTCLERRLLGHLWEWWTPPAHLSLFSPQGARLMLERAGFEVVHVITRRGDSAGAAANVLLAPARWLKRRLRGEVRQRSSAVSSTRRLAEAINRLYDPLSIPIRRQLYRERLLGPELVLVARRPQS